MSTPDTTVYFCGGTGLRNNYEHTRDFASREAQIAYFNSKLLFTQTNYMYLRKSYPIKINAPRYTVNNVDYLYFQNPDDRKYYFYFVTDIQYINDTTTELTIELDVMQTYMFDYTLQNCFIDRMHTATDEPGDNIVEENLELGDYYVTRAPIITGNLDYEMSDLCVMIMSSVSLLDDVTFGGKLYGSVYDGIYSGFYFYACLTQNFVKLQKIFSKLDDEGITDAISAMWMYPRNYVKLYDGYSWDNGVVPVEKFRTHKVEISDPEKIAKAYYPQNKKLLTYPYNMLYVTNNNGSYATFKFEKFSKTESHPNITFSIYGSVFPDGGLKLCPFTYNGKSGINFEDGLSLDGFPTCAWNSDIYKIWLAQNQTSNALTYVTAGAQIVGGALITAATGGAGAIAGGAMMANGASKIASQLAKTRDMEVQPPQAKGNQSTTINASIGAHAFEFLVKSVDHQHAVMIDNYFTAYGYKINNWGKPNITSRKRWNYVKTIGSCVKSTGIPVDDLKKIDSIYDNGITFWHEGTEIGDYFLINSIKEG